LELTISQAARLARRANASIRSVARGPYQIAGATEGAGFRPRLKFHREMRTARTPLLLLGLAAAVSIVSIAAGPPMLVTRRGIDPAAEQRLRAMANYLGSLQSFTVLSASMDEVVLGSGEKIQLASESLVSIERPNRLRSEQVGATGAGGLAFWYDGRTMTLACKADGSYATIPAPSTIDTVIDKVRKQYRIDAPGADFLYSHPYEVLTEQVVSGRYIGRETIDSVATEHLAFEGEAVDWQVWIQEGSQPLPLRFVVTTKGIKGRPQFTVRLSRWDPGIKVPPATWMYEPPLGARRLPSFPADCRPAQAARP
jgi:hypothetical protein